MRLSRDSNRATCYSELFGHGMDQRFKVLELADLSLRRRFVALSGRLVEKVKIAVKQLVRSGAGVGTTDARSVCFQRLSPPECRLPSHRLATVMRGAVPANGNGRKAGGSENQVVVQGPRMGEVRR